MSLALLLILVLRGGHAIRSPGDQEIGNILPCGTDNLSCPQSDGVNNPDSIDCLIRDNLCDGGYQCPGGADEGTNFFNLDCE